jgi:hypothetical protein
MDIEEVEHTPFNLQKKLILLLDFKVFKQNNCFNLGLSGNALKKW